MSKVISTTVLNPNGKEDTCAYAVIDSKELYYLLSPITVTDRHTISFYIKALANETLKLWYGEDYKEFSVTTSWQKIEWSFSAEHIDNVMLQFTQGNYYIYNTMFERGDVATDYRLSQADQDKILTNVEETLNAKYAQLLIALDNITLEVSETNGRVDKAESSIKIMSDNIALKVDKNGVISAINVSKENIKILAKMIDLVGQVTISDLADDVVVKVDDTTLIDGGKIYTDTLFAKDINVTGKFIGATLEAKDNENTKVSLGAQTTIADIGDGVTETFIVNGTRFEASPSNYASQEIYIGAYEQLTEVSGELLGIDKGGFIGSLDDNVTIMSVGSPKIIMTNSRKTEVTQFSLKQVYDQVYENRDNITNLIARVSALEAKLNS